MTGVGPAINADGFWAQPVQGVGSPRSQISGDTGIALDVQIKAADSVEPIILRRRNQRDATLRQLLKLS